MPPFITQNQARILPQRNIDVSGFASAIKSYRDKQAAEEQNQKAANILQQTEYSAPVVEAFRGGDRGLAGMIIKRKQLEAQQQAQAQGRAEASKFRMMQMEGQDRRHAETMNFNRERLNQDAELKRLAFTHKQQKEKNKKFSPSEMKHLFSAEDDVVALKNSLKDLNRAKTILPKTNQGFAPEARAKIGNMLPDFAVGDNFSSPESSEATAEYAQIMGQQTFETMSRLLKGAMSDSEMKAFQKIVSDTTLPHKVRQQALDRFIGAASSQLQLMNSRVGEIRGQDKQQAQDAPTLQDPLGIR